MILRWSEVGGMRVDEYYVVRIVYNERREQAEFWRQDASLEVPERFSTSEFGFQDRHYEWSVQTMRCISNCRKALDDEYTKRGTAVGGTSKTGLFYWHTDTGGNVGSGTPTPTSIGEDPKD